MKDTATGTRLIIPALKPLYDWLGRFSYPFIRIVIGLTMVPHGWDKLTVPKTQASVTSLIDKLGFHPATGFFWLIAGLEFFGGIMLALGLLTRLIALMFAVELMVIIFGVFVPGGRPIEYLLMWALIMLAFVFGGGGRYSLDRLIGREL
jgi:putative oxidoreductase